MKSTTAQDIFQLGTCVKKKKTQGLSPNSTLLNMFSYTLLLLHCSGYKF